jgi:hypothetical protein
MNERIQKLWQQANIRYSVYETLKPRDERKSIPDIFSELIVRDCAGIAHGSDQPSVDIKYYFGVEE